MHPHLLPLHPGQRRPASPTSRSRRPPARRRAAGRRSRRARPRRRPARAGGRRPPPAGHRPGVAVEERHLDVGQVAERGGHVVSSAPLRSITGAGSTSRMRSRGSPSSASARIGPASSAKHVDHRRIEDAPRPAAAGRSTAASAPPSWPKNAASMPPGPPASAMAMSSPRSPSGAQPPTQRLVHVVERLLRRVRQARAGGRCPAPPRTRRRRPAVPTPGPPPRRSRVRAGRRAGGIPRVSSGSSVGATSSGSAQVGAGHRPVEGDVVAERRRRLVGDRRRSRRASATRVEAVPDVLVVEIHPAGEGGGDHALRTAVPGGRPKPRSATIDSPPSRSARRNLPATAVNANGAAALETGRSHADVSHICTER